MRKILFAAAVVSIFLTILFISFRNVSSQLPENVSSQPPKAEKENGSQSKTVFPEQSVSENSELDSVYQPKWLRRDMQMVDFVAYINVTKVKYSGSDSKTTDCKNGGGGGYCFYDLTAEIKEVFKGKIDAKKFEYSTSADAGYDPQYFLGEKVVFLSWSEGDDKKKYLVQSLENSNRSIKYNVLEKLRNIIDPNAPIDDTDETEPYALKYIKNNFREADAVVYADVLSFEPDKSAEFGSEPFILRAEIKEIFKGNLKAGQNFEYHDDLLHRAIRQDDLGEQILYLQRKEENGKVFYEKVDYTEGWIQHDILGKMRRVAEDESNKKE